MRGLVAAAGWLPPLLLLLPFAPTLGAHAEAPPALAEKSHSRLCELFRSMRSTHGGPAYVSRRELDAIRRKTETRLREERPSPEEMRAGAGDPFEQTGSSAAEERRYRHACASAMRALMDPLAAHLSPTSAVMTRERFHGRASFGITLKMRLVRAKPRAVASHADADVGGDGGDGCWSPLRCAWRRWVGGGRGWGGWRMAALVSEIVSGSPAEVAGVRAGDELLAVCDHPCSGPTMASALELLDDGVEGEEVTLTLLRTAPPQLDGKASQAARSTAARAEPRAPLSRSPTTWTVRLLRTPLLERTVTSRALCDGSVHLIQIDAFGATTAGELRAALGALRRHSAAKRGGRAGGRACATLVLDVRGNAGGLLHEAVAACRMMLPMGAHIVSLNKEAPRRTVQAFRRRWYHRCELPPAIRTAWCGAGGGGGAGEGGGGEGGKGGEGGGGEGGGGVPLVILVDDASASSAEVFAAALAHAAGAIVIGQPTFGKGSSQAVVYQSDGYAIAFTAYTLAVGRRRGERPLSQRVQPHVPWRWRAWRSRGQLSDDAEVVRALAAARAQLHA